jgi:hypothetical protein
VLKRWLSIDFVGFLKSGVQWGFFCINALSTIEKAKMEGQKECDM